MGHLLCNTTPIYQHDCSKCEFLGTYLYRDMKDNIRQADLYYCAQLSGEDTGLFGKTVIGRYSSDGADYTSGMVFGQMQYREAYDTPLAKAYEICVEKGYASHSVNSW